MACLARSLFPRPAWRARAPLAAAAGRGITVRASQRKRTEICYEGPNKKLAEDAPDKARTRGSLDARSMDHIQVLRDMKRCVKGRDYGGALDAFSAVGQPDAPLYGSALHACAKAHWYDRAVGLWSAMPPELRSVVSYSVMIDLCGRQKRLSEAEHFLEEMRRGCLQPNIVTLTSMARAYGMADEPEAAEELLREGRAELASASHRGRQMFYQVVMTAVARSGDYAKTRELFMKMSESCTQPDHGHFNALLASCAKQPHAPTAESVFEFMGSCGMEPRVEDYNILMGCRRHDLARCLELYAELQTRGFRPTSSSQQQLLEAYVLAGDAQGALAFAAEAGELDRESAKVDRLLQQAEELARAAGA